MLLGLLAGPHVVHDFPRWPVGSERMHLQHRAQDSFMFKGRLLIMKYAYSLHMHVYKNMHVLHGDVSEEGLC